MTTLLFFFLLAAGGRIVDPAGRPIENAGITCGASHTTTNNQGRFTLPAACDAEISKPGFETRTAVKIGEDTEIALGISPTSDRVVVTAVATPVAIEEAGLAADIFTKDDFGPRRTPFVRDLLRLVPGLNLVQGGPNGGLTSLFTRGGNSDSGLILLDGIPLTEPGGRIDLAHVSSAGIDRMEAVRGPVSNAFGAEASTGVVQLFSTQGDVEARRPHGALSYERGNFSTDRWTANLNGGLFNRLDYSLTTDQYRSTGQFLNNHYRLTTGTGNVGYRLAESTSLRAIFRTYDSDAGVPGQVYYGLANLDAVERARDSSLGLRFDDARGRRFSQRAAFTYHRNRDRFTDTQSESYRIAALVRDEGSRVFLVRPVDPSTTTADPGTRLVKSTQTSFPFSGLTFTDRTGFNYQGTLTHRGGALVAGYEHEQQSGTISLQDVSRRNNGLFVQEQYALGTRIFLSAGARYEHSSTFGDRFIPRAAATFRLPRATFLRLSAGRGYKEPALIENFAKETFYVGNRSLRPAKTDTLDLGLSHEWFRRLRTEATYFRNSFTDLIVFDFATSPASWQNIDRSWARGLELTADLKLARLVTVRGSYAYLRTRITQTNSFGRLGTELQRRPRNSGSVTLQLTPRHVTILAGGRFVGATDDSDFGIFGVNRNPGYNTAFFSASWNASRHLEPYVRFDNAFDARYQEALGYGALGRIAVGGLRVIW